MAGRSDKTGGPGGEAVCDRGRRRRLDDGRLLAAGRRAHARPGCRACRKRTSRVVPARIGPGGNLGRTRDGAGRGGIRATLLAVERGAKLGPMRAIGALLILLWAQTAAAQTLLQNADAAYSAGERELARSLYQSVLASNPNNSRAVFQLARLLKPGSAEQIALLRRYVKLEPEDPWGYMALGDGLAKAGDVDEAIQQYRRARRRAPAETDVYVGLGRILRAAGRNDDLVANYEQWASAQPKNAQAWFELGRARERAKRYVEAA